MTDDYNSDKHDVRGESVTKTTRRGLLGALGVAGLASLGSSGASANLSGGPEADAMSEYRVPTYRVPESDLDSPGVVGRRVEITSGGSEWAAGDQLVDTGSSWELIDSGVGSLSAEKTSTEYLNADDVAGGISPAGKVTFQFDFVGEPFTDEDVEQDVYHRRYFDDNQYRVTIGRPSTNEVRLYKSPDLTMGSFSLIESDILPTEPVGGGTGLQDKTRLPDGTWAIYQVVNDADMIVWTGEDLTNLTKQGTVLTQYTDSGVYHEDGTVHIYSQNGTGKDSDFITHHTTPATDLLNATLQGDVVDVSDRGWKTGDVEVKKVGHYYYMFMDRHSGAPYFLALARAPSLDAPEWEIVTDKLTSVPGGDPVLTRRDGEFVCLTELSGENQMGIGLWTVRAVTQPARHHQIDRYRATSAPGFASYKFDADTLDGVLEGASGSGSVSLGTNPSQALLSTGATDNSHILLQKIVKDHPGQNTGWLFDRVFAANVRFADDVGNHYIVSGQVVKDDKTPHHVGFAIDGGNLIGTVGNGTNQTTATLLSAPSVPADKALRAEYYAGDRVEFFVDDERRGEISTGLPSGSNNANRMFTAFTENADSSASNREMLLYHSHTAQFD